MPEFLEFSLLSAFNRTSLNVTTQEFLSRNPNEFYQGGDLAWMMICSMMVLLMVPGLGLFYSGSSEKVSALSMIWYSIMTTTVIGFQWYLWGYSISFTGSNKLWGSADAIAFHRHLTTPWENGSGTKLPQMVYALFQGMFACFTGAIISGATIRKGDPLHFLVFIFIWSTFIYAPIARSTWNPIGWANYWMGTGSGVLDFAGGTVVHIVAAVTAGVYSIFFKWKRRIFKQELLTEEQINEGLNKESKPHNVVNTLLGTSLLYVGWFGFNGGSALGANLRAVSACISTHFAACAGGLTGTALEYWAARRNGDEARFSIIGLCNGVVTGLVAITPAAGYVPIWSAPVFGILSSFLCFTFEDWSQNWFDTHHILIMHGFSGFIGMMLTTAFASNDITRLDGHSTITIRKPEQLGLQLLDVTVNSLWAGLGTFLILMIMEILIMFYRKAQKLDEPPFKLIHDVDIVFNDQISEDFRATRKDVELQSYPASHTAGHSSAHGGGPGVAITNHGSNV